MGEPAYKLEPREKGWLIYVNEDLDRGELAEFLDYVILQSIRKRGGSTGEHASAPLNGAKRNGTGNGEAPMLVNVDVARADLPGLIERACAGEEIVITQGTEPVVKLTPVSDIKPPREPGSLKGELVVPDEFFDPLPADELAAWEQ
ncbi:MAG TPA: type II toxin-antitoxin system prevent-host-death family antitoxin [Longimicrobium sp.]|jgi:prevent-host-death family protein